MGDLLKAALNLFSGGAGSAVGHVATFAGIIAALTPAAIFLVSDKGAENFVEISYRDAAFWGTVIAVNLAVALLTRRNNAG